MRYIFAILLLAGGVALASTAATPTRIVLVFGQSNANASSATSPFSATQDGGSLMFETQATSALRDGGCASSAAYVTSMTVPVDAGHLVALVESETEKPRSVISAYLKQETGTGAVTSTVAFGGYAQACLKKATVPYQSVTNTFENLRREGVWKNHGTNASISVVWIQGEQDEILGTTAAAYALAMEEMQGDIQNLIGQYTELPLSNPVRLFMVQAQSWTDGTAQTTPRAAIGMYNYAKAFPARAVIATPTYPYSVAEGSTVHRDTLGACHSHAAIGRAIQAGASWTGFRPRTVVLSGTTLTATFDVPTCPMVVDTTTVTGVSTATRGFEYDCSSSPPSISSVTNTSCAANVGTLTIELDGNPDGTCESNDVLRYAYTMTAGNAAGPTTGPRGNLRDSGGSAFNCGATSVTPYAWLVTFSESVSGS